jgi:predicted acylesterase/phospholipase RssA
MRALVLSGGGALGAFEAGLIRGIWDAGERFDLICGTSIGAINASFVAQDKIDELSAVWHGIGNRQPPVIQYVDQVQRAIAFVTECEAVGRGDVPKLAEAVLRWMQIGSKKALLQLRGFVSPNAITEILGALDFNALKSSLIVTASNLTFGSSDAFYAFIGPEALGAEKTFLSAREGLVSHPLMYENFALAVRASAAIPFAFEPVPMNLGAQGNKDYVDGGVANNVPVSLAADAGSDDILVVLLQPAQATQPIYQTGNLVEIGLGSLTLMQQRLLEQDMNSANQRSGVNVRSVRPSAALPLSILDFGNQAAINAAFDQGQQAAQQIKALEKVR